MQGVYLRPIACGSSSSRCILRLEKPEAFFERVVGHGASQQAKVRQQLSDDLGFMASTRFPRSSSSTSAARSSTAMSASIRPSNSSSRKGDLIDEAAPGA
jgi:hypothetical protein